MRAGIAAAEAEPPADPALVFEYAYADPPAGLADDLAELRRILVAELTLLEAVNDCLHVELERDDSVLVMGEDVGRAGRRLPRHGRACERFGPDRCVDTPLAEAGILGAAVGLCMAGWRPVCEMQYDAFSYPCLDQLINHVGRYRWRTRGAMEFPLVVRMPYGGGVRAPELHDDSPEAYYVHTPGVKVAIPSTPADAKGLLAAAIRDPDPVVIFEPKLVYRTSRGEVPEGEHVVPLGKMRVAREGTDLTIVAYGAMVPVAEQAADALGASVEVLDVRTLKPLDEETLLASVAKTGRVVIVQEAPRVAGFAAELAAVIAEKAILDLRGPVLRVTGYDVPYPYWQIEDAYMPSVERVVAAGRRLLTSSDGLRVQAAGSRRGPDRGRGRPLAGRGGPGDRRGRPARRDPDRQDDGRDPLAGGREGRADPRRGGRGRPGRDRAGRDRRGRRAGRAAPSARRGRGPGTAQPARAGPCPGARDAARPADRRRSSASISRRSSGTGPQGRGHRGGWTCAAGRGTAPQRVPEGHASRCEASAA